MELTLLESKYALAAFSAAGGVILTIVAELLLRKRGRLTYFVRHFRIAVSDDDEVFGSVRVTWNGNLVANLYLSTVELINESLTDFENVVVTAFTADSILLTERTELVGTGCVAKWTEEYRSKLAVAPDQDPSTEQINLHARQRDYHLPVLNRGQIVRFHFLNASKGANQPSIWLDIVHKGLKLKFHTPQNQIFGVAQPLAALVGAILGFIFVAFIIAFVGSIWIAALSAMIYGFFAQVPGAGLVRAWRRIRESLGG